MIHVLDLGGLPYPDYLALGRALIAARATEAVPDLLLFATHPPVITLGLSSTPDEILNDSIPTVAIERGGHTTYHGPDQQMLYPVMRLEYGELHGFVHQLQEVVVLACSALGVSAFRREGYPGVWTERGKIASLGLALKKHVTLHGMALNCEPAESGGFDAIVPCGLSDITMTNLQVETGFPPSRAGVRSALAAAWELVHGTRVTMADRTSLPMDIQALLPPEPMDTAQPIDDGGSPFDDDPIEDDAGLPYFRFSEAGGPSNG